ncbi:MAG: JAB domain-containing protein [Patescibacteria group bacterium]
MKTIKEYSLKIVERDSDFKKIKIGSSADIYKFVKEFYFDDINIFESFFAVFLSRSNTTTGYVKISQGGTAGTVVDIKIIAKYAIDSLCAGVILCHNHPSGNLLASDQDIQLTKKAKQGLRLLDINILDHIIITESGYLSFADEGLMD